MADNENIHTQSTNPIPLPIHRPLDGDPFHSDSAQESDPESDTHSLDLIPPRRPSATTVARHNNHPIRYAFSQLFGELCNDSSSVVTDADMITAVRFSNDSNMIAAGDKGGRIVLLKRLSSGAQRKRRQRPRYGLSRTKWSPVGGGCMSYEFEQQPLSADDDDDDDDYIDHHSDDSDTVPDRPLFDFWTQFQSHEKELDYLKNLDILEKINQICWCRPVSGTQRLLVSNEKTIKLWRVHERDVKRVVSVDPSTVPSRNGTPLPNFQTRPLSTCTPISLSHQSSQPESTQPEHTPPRFPLNTSFLKFPRMEVQAHIISASPKQIYRNFHYYHINSISLNSDEETFLSADDLRINLYNLHRNGCGFNILYIQPDSSDNFGEVITSAEFHPQHCNLFAYSNAQAAVKLCDLRESALCRTWARQFQENDPSTNQSSFLAEMIASISDMKFSPDGQFIMTRDYMNLRLWDVRMEGAPVLLIPAHEHLRSRLCDLYQSDCIFDRFQCRFSGDGGSLLTGSYCSLFQTFSAHDGTCSAQEASFETVTGMSGRQHFSSEGLSASLLANSSLQDLMDPMKRIQCLDSSPQDEIAAVAVGPAVYFYHGTNR